MAARTPGTAKRKVGEATTGAPKVSAPHDPRGEQIACAARWCRRNDKSGNAAVTAGLKKDALGHASAVDGWPDLFDVCDKKLNDRSRKIINRWVKNQWFKAHQNQTDQRALTWTEELQLVGWMRRTCSEATPANRVKQRSKVRK